jgi:hypothetical protein
MHYITPRDLLDHYKKNPISAPVLSDLRMSVGVGDDGPAHTKFYWRGEEFKIDYARFNSLDRYYKDVLKLAEKLKKENFDFQTFHYE